MPFHVMLIVLLSALLHAAWNAFIKSGDNKFVETTLLVTGAGAIAAVVLPFVPGPAPASWPFLGASVAIHCVYFSLVALAYRTGDLSFAYPIMRGSAPLFTAVLTAVILGEPIGGGGWLGILLLCAGILWLGTGRLEIGQQPGARVSLCTAQCRCHCCLHDRGRARSSCVGERVELCALAVLFEHVSSPRMRVREQCQGVPLYAGRRVA